MPTIFGDDPEPPRYFVCEQPAVEGTKSELPDWRQFVLVVMRPLLPFPEAKEAVLLAFREHRREGCEVCVRCSPVCTGEAGVPSGCSAGEGSGAWAFARDLNCSRQWGKSTTMAIKAVHRTYFVPKSQVLVVGPSERQSGELVAKAREFLRMVGVKPRGDGRNATSILLPSGSRIVALPNVEKNIRGFTASMLLVDEAARVPDDLYDAVRPMLAVSRGELWLMSNTGWEARVLL